MKLLLEHDQSFLCTLSPLSHSFSSFKLPRSLPFPSFGHNKSYSTPKCFSLASHSVSYTPRHQPSQSQKCSSAGTLKRRKLILQHWLVMIHLPSGQWDRGFAGTTPWEGIRQGVPFSESLICVPAFLCAPVLPWISAAWLLMDWWLLEWAWGSQGRVLVGESLLLCLCVPLGCAMGLLSSYILHHWSSDRKSVV